MFEDLQKRELNLIALHLGGDPIKAISVQIALAICDDIYPPVELQDISSLAGSTFLDHLNGNGQGAKNWSG
jgi:hypothetical protein